MFLLPDRAGITKPRELCGLLEREIFSQSGTSIGKQFFHARILLAKKISSCALSVATSMKSRGSRESFRRKREGKKTTLEDPFDASASRYKIGDSLEVVTLVYVVL